MHIYRCEFELMENLFFASREVKQFFPNRASYWELRACLRARVVPLELSQRR